ncbi:MAG: PilZ domain-containing protein [Bacteriovoracia bacterium]
METSFIEHRREKRIPTAKYLRVYTSASRAAYTVPITNISSKGAFIKSKFLPQIDETINFEAMDQFLRPVFSGLAKVKWIDREFGPDSWGYGVEFEGEFPLEKLETFH